MQTLQSMQHIMSASIASFARPISINYFCIFDYTRHHNMFIVIYKEGTQYHEALIKETFALANMLESPKYIFSWGGGYELHSQTGVQHYDTHGDIVSFKHDKYHLTHITKGTVRNSSNSQKQFDFIFRYDNNRDVVIKDFTTEDNFPSIHAQFF